MFVSIVAHNFQKSDLDILKISNFVTEFINSNSVIEISDKCLVSNWESF